MALRVPNLIKIFFYRNFNTDLAPFIGNTAALIHLDTYSIATKIYIFPKDCGNCPVKSIKFNLQNIGQ